MLPLPKFDPSKYGKPRRRSLDRTVDISPLSSVAPLTGWPQDSNSSQSTVTAGKNAVTASESDIHPLPCTTIQKPAPEINPQPLPMFNPQTPSKLAGQSKNGSHHSNVAQSGQDGSSSAFGTIRDVTTQVGPGISKGNVEVSSGNNAAITEAVNHEPTYEEIERQVHDQTLALYRNASPEEKQALIKKQQAEIFLKTRIAQERKSKVSLARQSSEQSTAPATPLQKSLDLQTNISLATSSKPTLLPSPFPNVSPTKQPAINTPCKEVPFAENEPLSKAVDLSGSKWSAAKNRPSPLRNAVVFTDPSAQSEQIDEQGWPLLKTPVRPTQPVVKPPSNAWGSDLPSDAHSSDDARKPTGYGKLFKQQPGGSGVLGDQNGKLACPPEDWDDRPIFNNNDEAFRKFFNQWLDSNMLVTFPKKAGTTDALPMEQVVNSELCPDGIGFVTKDYTLDTENCRLYGYGYEAPDEIRDDIQRLRPEDFEDWGKLDMSVEINALHNDETALFLSQNYMGHKLIEERKRTSAIQQLRKADEERPQGTMSIKAEPQKVAARADLCIRPAKLQDMTQLAEIYNHYIRNSARTTELDPVDTHIMEDRLMTAYHDKLPFFVALARKPAQNKIIKNLFEATHDEKVLGYVLAQDFSGVTLAERFTSELELYVHPNWVRKGVGTALLDKVIEVCDATWVPRKGYLFTCQPGTTHRYGSGGIRDLVSVIFVIRHYSRFKNGEEPDYPWIKKWLEKDFGFKEEACLPRCSVKHGRYANLGYLMRRTHFPPGQPE